jgi:hypothetical protein
MPAGYKISPHWHGKVEHVTVISGKFNLGMGEKFDDSEGNAMPAGTFGFLPPQMKHFAWASEATVIQLHGEGPWEINYVNPSDDPRKKGDHDDLQTVSLSRHRLCRLRLWLSGKSSGRGRGPASA